MDTNELNKALYEKMDSEQNEFWEWLKSQSTAEVLNHAYEYAVREDIVMAMEELELTDAQAQALLDSPISLADVYRHFEKLETGYMDVIRESIENRADDVCKARRSCGSPLFTLTNDRRFSYLCSYLDSHHLSLTETEPQKPAEHER